MGKMVSVSGGKNYWLGSRFTSSEENGRVLAHPIRNRDASCDSSDDLLQTWAHDMHS